MELNVNSLHKSSLSRVCIVFSVCMYVQLVFYSYLKCISGNWVWETKYLVIKPRFQAFLVKCIPFFLTERTFVASPLTHLCFRVFQG